MEDIAYGPFKKTIHGFDFLRPEKGQLNKCHSLLGMILGNFMSMPLFKRLDYTVLCIFFLFTKKEDLA